MNFLAHFSVNCKLKRPLPLALYLRRGMSCRKKQVIQKATIESLQEMHEGHGAWDWD